MIMICSYIILCLCVCVQTLCTHRESVGCGLAVAYIGEYLTICRGNTMFVVYIAPSKRVSNNHHQLYTVYIHSQTGIQTIYIFRQQAGIFFDQIKRETTQNERNKRKLNILISVLTCARRPSPNQPRIHNCWHAHTYNPKTNHTFL